MIASLTLSICTLYLATNVAAADGEATPAKPFQFHVSVGATHEDNLFRLMDSSEGQALLNTEDLADWYHYLGAGFSGVIANDNQRFELLGDIQRQAYDRFSDLDHTSGRFRGVWHWRVSEQTRGELGYRYRRELRSFTNQNVPYKDIIEQNTVFAAIERTIAQRWLLRVSGEADDFTFSGSPLLQKQRGTVEAELRYAASQQSTFGIITTFTNSAFDANQGQVLGVQ
ncbi:MAG: hypothetical protein RIA65_05685 [Woeseia sp.]